MHYKHRFMKPQASHCMTTSSSILKSQLKRMLISDMWLWICHLSTMGYYWRPWICSSCSSTMDQDSKSQLKRMLIRHVTVNMSFINNGLLLEIMNMFFLFINNGPIVCGKVSWILGGFQDKLLTIQSQTKNVLPRYSHYSPTSCKTGLTAVYVRNLLDKNQQIPELYCFSALPAITSWAVAVYNDDLFPSYTIAIRHKREA